MVLKSIQSMFSTSVIVLGDVSIFSISFIFITENSWDHNPYTAFLKENKYHVTFTVQVSTRWLLSLFNEFSASKIDCF